MKGANGVLSVLNGLAAQDRTWLLDNLPADAKVRLLARSATATGEGGDSPRKRSVEVLEVAGNAPLTPAEGAMRHLEAVDVSALARLLEKEPAWVAGALLGIQNWPWRGELLRSLPQSTRLDVECGAYANCHLSARFSQALIQCIADKLDRQPPSRPASKFEILLERLATRTSGRRSTAP